MKIKAILFCLLLAGVAHGQDQKMDRFIDELLRKMTVEEKLGQLNLSSGVGDLKVITEGEGRLDYIKQGLIGSAWGMNSQKAAVEESRMGIPLITGRDVIHGYKTTFPIPLAMSCMWDVEKNRKDG
jgi:beta-glucosidase